MSTKTQMGLGIGLMTGAADAVLLDREEEDIMLNFVSAESPWGQAVQRVRISPNLLDDLLDVLNQELEDLEVTLNS